MEKLVHITQAQISLEGILKIPQNPQGIILFVHGSGSSRFSPRNNFVANMLYEGNCASLLIDLLSQQEDEVYKTRFNIDLLVERLMIIIQWLEKQQETQHLSLGLFGSSTGAAAALYAASMMGKKIKSVVSRGGRPDLAMPVLDQVTAPTLFIVGGDDIEVLKLNEIAFQKLKCIKKFEIIPSATHLFEEPGCLEEVASLSREWFQKYLTLEAIRSWA